MLGDNHKLRDKLKQGGRRADAEVLEVKERPWATRRPGEIGAHGTYHLKLRVSPAGEEAFDADLTDQWRDAGEPSVGQRVPVLYDPGHPSKLVLDDSPGRYSLIEPATAPGLGTINDPELAALAELDAQLTPAAPPPAAGADRLDQLSKLGELHATGVLSDEEFATEKARILSGP